MTAPTSCVEGSAARTGLHPAPVGYGVVTADVIPVAPRLAEDLRRVDADEVVDDTDGPEWAGVAVHGDLVGWEASGLTVSGCRLAGLQLTGARLEGARFIDVVFDSCELSGALLERAAFQRVELRQCRVVGALLGAVRLRNVHIVGCKLDRSVLAGAVAERLVVSGSMLVECDLRDARFPAARFVDCDLTNAEVTGADLSGARLHGSQLDGLRGVRGLAGALIDTDQVLTLAPLLLADAGIAVTD